MGWTMPESYVRRAIRQRQRTAHPARVHHPSARTPRTGHCAGPVTPANVPAQVDVIDSQNGTDAFKRHSRYSLLFAGGS